MNELKTVGRMVAANANDLIPTLIENTALPSITTRMDALHALNGVVEQSPPEVSRRVWATLFAVATAVLAVPEVQALLGPWAPVATAAISALLAAWSKASDPRPTR